MGCEVLGFISGFFYKKIFSKFLRSREISSSISALSLTMADAQRKKAAAAAAATANTVANIPAHVSIEVRVFLCLSYCEEC